MTAFAYYNELDPYAAQWLRNLMQAGHIAPGYVDERSIEDVKPDDLAGFTQCHFFAGIGVWSLALRRAGWRDDQEVWTGSCPCQPFSAAGKGSGFADERHLWPAFFHIITQRHPARVYGEQVASLDGLAWLDLVQTDLESAGYAAGAADLCAAGVGAPHIRQRLYWVADSELPQRGACDQRSAIDDGQAGGWLESSDRAGERGEPFGLADADQCAGGQGSADLRGGLARSDAGARTGLSGIGLPFGLANTEGLRQQGGALRSDGGPTQRITQDSAPGGLGDLPSERCGEAGRLGGGPEERLAYAGATTLPSAGPTNGNWRDADWLFCRDGKWRPVEPGTFPLAHGATARVGRLRAYGNAITPQQAEAFIRSTL